MITKVTVERLDSKIQEAKYIVLEGTTTTLCTLHLVNGYCVHGFSACVDPKNFNEVLGRQYSYEDAFKKLWPLEGYLLAEELYSIKL